MSNLITGGTQFVGFWVFSLLSLFGVGYAVRELFRGQRHATQQWELEEKMKDQDYARALARLDREFNA